ncbi:hypothetical protein FMUND_9703 [Fusarium mundagurra]|uniref:Uncharacterized protein n=1 Tax=Fusarium mundagurra TaxID=1567541 RepID=A0A8H5YF06_9HYPO|nr:hypothetical protein FMUND_9703 [Fusarium mundagurra]
MSSQNAVENYYKAHKLVERVEDWANEVSIATEDMEFVEPADPKAKVPRIIKTLLEQHEEARAIMYLIEEQLLKLNYELPQKDVTEPQSSKHGYIPLGSDSEDSFKKKQKKRSKRPKTEEEKNRHINKVFIRENGVLPLLDHSAQL